MKKHFFFWDAALLVFLAYLYLWKVQFLFSVWGIISFAYLVCIALAGYFFLLGVLRVNRFAALLGTVVFAFSGSGLTLLEFSHSIPYPGIIPVIISCICFPKHKKGILKLYVITALLFLLVYISFLMHLPLSVSSLVRLFFNACFGTIAAISVDAAQVVDKVYSSFRKIFLGALLVLLPLAYAVLIQFMELSKAVLPYIVSTVDAIAIFVFFLGWVLLVCREKGKIRLSAAESFITLFFIVIDIFTYWQP